MSKKNKNLSGIVYSTNPDFKLTKEDTTPAPTASSKQDLRVWKEFHGGKAVTIVRNFSGSPAELEKLGKELKIKCGVGGTVKNHEIQIQGDQRDKIVKILLEKGFLVKKAGG
jgi:translation initiation factor 1